MKDLKALSIRGLEARALARLQPYCVLFTTPGMGQCKAGTMHSPPIYLPSVLPDITPHVTRFPIPSILHTAGGQRLEVGMAWE